MRLRPFDPSETIDRVISARAENMRRLRAERAARLECDRIKPQKRPQPDPIRLETKEKRAELLFAPPAYPKRISRYALSKPLFF